MGGGLSELPKPEDRRIEWQLKVERGKIIGTLGTIEESFWAVYFRRGEEAFDKKQKKMEIEFSSYRLRSWKAIKTFMRNDDNSIISIARLRWEIDGHRQTRGEKVNINNISV